MSSGREFHTTGLETRKLLRPKQRVLVRGVARCLCSRTKVGSRPDFRDADAGSTEIPNNTMSFWRKVGFLLLLCSQINSVFMGISLRRLEDIQQLTDLEQSLKSCRAICSFPSRKWQYTCKSSVLKDQSLVPKQQDLQCKEETKLIPARILEAPQNPNNTTMWECHEPTPTDRWDANQFNALPRIPS